MANKPLVSVQFPGLDPKYTVPQIDNTLSVTGKAADAKKTGDEITELKQDLTQLSNTSTITDTASGAIASFPDGADDVPVVDLVAEIEPVQDLHGQSSPYPAGCGKNKLSMSLSGIKSINTSGTWSGNTYTLNDVTFSVNTDDADNIIGIQVSGTASAEAVFKINSSTMDSLEVGSSYILSGCPSGGSQNTYCLFINYKGIDSGAGYSFTAESTANLFCAISIKSGVSGSNKIFYPMVRLSTISDATFAPYSNFCPISGWTGANVVRTGFNLWNGEYSETGNFLGSDGAYLSNQNYNITSYIPIVGGASYFIHSFTSVGAGSYHCWYDKDKNFISSIGSSSETAVTAPANAFFMRLSAHASYRGTASLNYPSTDHDYHAYNGEVYSIDWTTEAGTVYGGTLDVTSGVLTVTVVPFTFGSETWTWFSGADPFFYTTLNLTGGENASGDYFAENGVDVYITAGSHQARIYPSRNSFVDENTDCANLMSGMKLLYTLVTPVTYQLTPTEVATILGQNNIFADCGDVDVTYKADTKLYIQKVVSG